MNWSSDPGGGVGDVAGGEAAGALGAGAATGVGAVVAVAAARAVGAVVPLGAEPASQAAEAEANAASNTSRRDRPLELDPMGVTAQQ
ncbi:MAG TPA: hypothetical protein VMG12_03330 [Polyangiaceae bacterium]|nr:hypothetical protein [Polyangiaceae bacterium]